MRTALWTCALVVGSVAVAAADGPQWQYELEHMVKPGQKAALILAPRNDVSGITVELQSGDLTRTLRVKSIKAGQRKRLTFAVPDGAAEWTGTLTGSAGGQTASASINFKTVKVGPLDVRISKEGVDLVEGRVLIKPTRPLDRAEVVAFGDGGQRVVDATVPIVSEGEQTVVAFDVPDDTRLARVEMKLHDAYGYWVALRIVSWYAEIAHDDVEFESARWDVRAEEAPKIDRAITEIKKEVQRFRKELGNDAATVEARLYVAGYTDTVGSASDNRTLSRKRAQAIAQYFKRKGLGLPIYYQGFGEAVLAVQTPDETDQPRNRRAVYVLTNVPPGGKAYPGRAWTRLR